MRTQIFWKSVWIFEVETFIIFFLKKKNDLHSGLEIEQSVYTLHIHIIHYIHLMDISKSMVAGNNRSVLCFESVRQW